MGKIKILDMFGLTFIEHLIQGMQPINCKRIFAAVILICLLFETSLGIPVQLIKSNGISSKNDKLNSTKSSDGVKLSSLNFTNINTDKNASKELELTNEYNLSINNKNSENVDSNIEDLAVADGLQLEPPTAKILVTVRRRSGRFWEPWELNYNVCPPSICTSNSERRPRGTAGSVFYNGDIILDKESEKIIYGNNLGLRYKRATMRSSRTWMNATVPYVFASDIAPKSKSVIKKAMKAIENQTCINFRPRKLRDEDYVRFISEPGCWSSVGRVGGEQKVSIGLGCERLGTAIHEISHALGFWHEQARPDRDSYVKILEENISPRYLPDFSKANKSLVTSRGFPYDYESVMHYSKKAFTNLGDDTIKVDTIKVLGIGKKLNITIGQRDMLSNIDVAQLRDMYKCNDMEDAKVMLCPKDWQKIGRNCYKFESEKADQFAGAYRHCDELNSKLLFIEDEAEDEAIKRYLKKHYSDIKVWRTGGRVVNGTFVWYRENNSEKMDYTKWKKGHPSSFSSLALVYNKKKDRVRWEGVWLGSYSQLPQHAYPFICERRARRKCITGDFADGRDYRGDLDYTMDGYTCQKWSSQYPWEHKLLPYPYTDLGNDTDGLGDHNYCRNPSGERKSKPWCYTTKSKYKWQYCDISICSKKDNSYTTDERKGSNPRRSANKPDKENGQKAQKDEASIDTFKKNNTTIKRDQSSIAKGSNSNTKGNSNKQNSNTQNSNKQNSNKQNRNSEKKTNRKDRNNRQVKNNAGKNNQSSHLETKSNANRKNRRPKKSNKPR